MFIMAVNDFINNNLDDSLGLSEIIKIENFISSNDYKYSMYDLSILLKNEKLQRILKNIDLDYLDMDGIGDICVSLIEIFNAGGIIDDDPQREILKRIKAGDKKARDKFIVENQGLVYKVANAFVGNGIDFEDLVQEGNFGLIEAIDRFDVSRGFRFSTYAVHWIKCKIRNAVFSDSKVIRVPRHLEGKVNLYKRVRENFINKYDREPSTSELSKLMNLSISEVDFIIQTQMSVTSLDAPVGVEEDTNLEELLDSGVASPIDVYLKKELAPQVDYVLNNSGLTEREIDVIKYKYGFYGSKMTLEEVGAIFNITRERVRQIETKALRKLRRSINVERLIDFSSNPEESKKFINNVKNRKH